MLSKIQLLLNFFMNCSTTQVKGAKVSTVKGFVLAPVPNSIKAQINETALIHAAGYSCWDQDFSMPNWLSVLEIVNQGTTVQAVAVMPHQAFQGLQVSLV